MRTAEIVASRILFWGGVLSVALMAVGVVGFGARGGLTPEYLAEWRRAEQRPAVRPPDVFVSAADVARALARRPVEPLAVVAAGILLLLVTPFVSVVSVFVVFLAAGDRRYASIAAVLVGALLVSLLVVGGGR